MSERYKRETLKINRKHEEFARRLLTDTKTPEYQIYKEVFGLKSDNKSTLSGSACQLKTHPVFAAYLESVKAEIRGHFMSTVEQLVAELEEARQIGKEIKAPGPMVAATMGKAKLYGLDRQVEEEAAEIAPVQVIIQVQDASDG